MRDGTFKRQRWKKEKKKKKVGLHQGLSYEMYVSVIGSSICVWSSLHGDFRLAVRRRLKGELPVQRGKKRGEKKKVLVESLK
jgi:hypothetical protein